LFLCLIIVFLVGLIVPQQSLLGRDLYLGWKDSNPGLVSFLELLGLTDIYTSPLTIILWCLFFMNLVFVMIQRIPLIWKLALKRDLPQDIDSLKRTKHYAEFEGGDVERAKGILRKRGYRVFSGDGLFRAVKHRFSPLATAFFHLSFLLILIGGLMSVYTKFRAEAVVAVGETFTGKYQWVMSPKIGSIPKATFTVEEIKPTYYRGSLPLDLKVVLHTPGGRKVIGVNTPYKEGNLSFVIKKIDMLPLFIMKNKMGREIDSAYVKLTVLGGDMDSFTMKGYKFNTFFSTDYSKTKTVQENIEDTGLPQVLRQSPMGREKVQQAMEVKDPAFFISVIKDGEVLNEMTIKPGESIEFDSFRLIFSDLDYWVKFYVGKEHGLGILYTGFVLMILALIVRFVFFRRDIYGLIRGGSLHIGGKGEFYQTLFEEEFRKVTELLKAK
jgi:cytochrome c biogenesis protein ResB